jgi:hypothetical protein
MTEQQREDDFLSRLLDASEDTVRAASADDIAFRSTSGLTRRDEQALLQAANRIGTPTLAPQAFDAQEATSFTGEVAALVRRYPIPALAIGVGVAYLLTRRR